MVGFQKSYEHLRTDRTFTCAVGRPEIFIFRCATTQFYKKTSHAAVPNFNNFHQGNFLVYIISPPRSPLSRFSSFIVQKLAHLSTSKKIGIIYRYFSSFCLANQSESAGNSWQRQDRMAYKTKRCRCVRSNARQLFYCAHRSKENTILLVRSPWGSA